MQFVRFKTSVSITDTLARTMATTHIEAGKKAAAYHAVDLHIHVCIIIIEITLFLVYLLIYFKIISIILKLSI